MLRVLLLGAGRGLGVSSSDSFCFLTHDMLGSHPDISQLTSFAFWLLETNLNHMGLGEPRGQEVKVVEQSVVKINSKTQV